MIQQHFISLYNQEKTEGSKVKEKNTPHCSLG